MLNGLGRQVRWRSMAEEPPGQTGNVLAAQFPDASPLYGEGGRAVCRAAYWDGREFRTQEAGLLLRGITHWMPYPELPSYENMRRVFRALLGTEAPQC